ncbi:fumarylacetoacetase [Arthrobacter sp. KNU40]|uniref:fumarylacetoacetase n=1 Tax=Arthrobacter sp. KNU40 TaxID=3447965 RepID=UPI003F61FB1E
MTTWLPLSQDDGFGHDHLPYGVISISDGPHHLATRIGEFALDLTACAEAAGLTWAPAVAGPTLNPLLEAGPHIWREVRTWIQQALTDESKRASVEPHLVRLSHVTTHLPFAVADYVDFYTSENHASNVGRIFRPDGPALTPNWKHLPIGYHGRSSTIVVSGTDVVRPVGQRKSSDGKVPDFGPTVKLDLEAELGFVVGGSTPMGSRVPVGRAPEHLFGVVLFNDWSARDIQAWEYVPLGPHLGKSFCSSVGAWVTPMAALEAAHVPLPQQDPVPLMYLQGPPAASFGLDIRLEIELNGEIVSRPPYASVYWSPAQMLAHMTINGASLTNGDFFASGTVSGPEPQQRGSLLELTWDGRDSLTLVDGSQRTYLEDGDTVVIRATAPGTNGGLIRLAEVSGTIQSSTVDDF